MTLYDWLLVLWIIWLSVCIYVSIKAIQKSNELLEQGRDLDKEIVKLTTQAEMLRVVRSVMDEKQNKPEKRKQSNASK